MNTKFDNLMYKAGLTAQGSWDQMDDYDQQSIMRFARMIVEECAEQIRMKGTDWIDWQPSQQGIRPEYVAMAEHIKQHFGVTE